MLPYGSIVQLVSTLACHARGRGFEPRWSRQGLPFNTFIRPEGINVLKNYLESVLELIGKVVYLRSVLTNSKTRNESLAPLAQLVEQLICQSNSAKNK